MKKTEIIVDQSGNMKIEQLGFSGPACEEATKKIMAGIKGAVVSDIKKPEFHNRATVGDKATARW